MIAVKGLEKYLLPILVIVGIVVVAISITLATAELISPYIVVGMLSIVVVAISVTLATRNRKIFEDLLKKTEIEEADKKVVKKEAIAPPTRTGPSLVAEDVERTKGELRIMDVEKEIVGYALTRLYEAEAEGKLSEKDRVMLLDKYRKEMERLDKEIEKKQMIVKLHDLEETKADLIEMFRTKIDEISRNIECIKSTLGIAPAEPTQVKTRPPQPVETQPTQVKKEEGEKAAPRPRAKSKAEERIEAIQEEVLKVLERLEQIETEK